MGRLMLNDICYTGGTPVNAVVHTLYSGTAGSLGTVQLDGHYTDYDLLIVKCFNTDGTHYTSTAFETKNILLDDDLLFGNLSFANVIRRLIGCFSATDEVTIKTVENGTQLKEIVGIKFADGEGTWYDFTGTLEAGETSLTIANAKITTDSTIDVYTDTFDISPTNQVVTSGQIVLTFEAQANDLGVKVRIS